MPASQVPRENERKRRLTKGFERIVASAEAFFYADSVMLLTRRLAWSA